MTGYSAGEKVLKRLFSQYPSTLIADNEADYNLRRNTMRCDGNFSTAEYLDNNFSTTISRRLQYSTAAIFDGCNIRRLQYLGG